MENNEKNRKIRKKDKNEKIRKQLNIMIKNVNDKK